MKLKTQFFVASGLAALVGWFVFPYLVGVGTLYASQSFATTQLLLATGLHGQPLYWTLHVYDFVVWVALAIPTAVVLRLLKPRHLVWYTALATVPYFAWVLSFGSNLGFVGQYALLFLAAPATAVALVAFIERRLRPNNSFKPTPLRGAA